MYYQLKPGTQIKAVATGEVFSIVSIDTEIANIPKSQCYGVRTTIELDNGRFYQAETAHKQLVAGEIEIINAKTKSI